MPLIQVLHSDLPHLDPPPSSPQAASARALIAASLPPTTPLHPSISTTYTPTFSPLLSTAHTSIATTGRPRSPTAGIDLTRYEEPDAPTGDPAAAHTALRTAAVAQQYLAQRQLNLGLLETYGRNAWLIGNSQVEDALRALEREVKAARAEAVAVEEARRARQEGVRGEMEGLAATFRERLGRAVEAEVAGAEVRERVREARWRGRA